jgi:hypothetical protein
MAYKHYVGRPMAKITTARIAAILGPAPKPMTVWQHQFDGNDDVLQRLAQCNWDEAPQGLLREYILDLAYQELQPDLFRHLFPACLKFWYDTLMEGRAAELGDADFHYSLLEGDILERMLNDGERQRVFEFFADGFLDRLDVERGFRYRPGGQQANAWIGRFNSIGLVAPVIPTIWESWWALDTPGRAVSTIMYASGLIYREGENPIYHAWTPVDGGGGPYLTEWDSSVFRSAWLDENLSFLRSILSPSYVQERVASAANV